MNKVDNGKVPEDGDVTYYGSYLTITPEMAHEAWKNTRLSDDDIENEEIKKEMQIFFKAMSDAYKEVYNEKNV